jgi:hypothetical protein
VGQTGAEEREEEWEEQRYQRTQQQLDRSYPTHGAVLLSTSHPLNPCQNPIKSFKFLLKNMHEHSTALQEAPVKVWQLETCSSLSTACQVGERTCVKEVVADVYLTPDI